MAVGFHYGRSFVQGPFYCTTCPLSFSAEDINKSGHFIAKAVYYCDGHLRGYNAVKKNICIVKEKDAIEGKKLHKIRYIYTEPLDQITEVD